MSEEIYRIIDDISYADVDYLVGLRDEIVREKGFAEALPIERIANALDKLIELKR